MNRGALDLARKLDADGHGARARLARELEVTPDYVSHWLSARHRPMTGQRVKIQKLHGVDVLAWDEDIEEQSNPTEAA